MQNQEKAGDPAAGPTDRGRTLVLGIGSIAAGDDGFGPAVLDALKGEPLPDDVELADLGTTGIDLLSEFEEIDRLIVIDAVRMCGPEGAVGESRGTGERGLEREVGRSQHWAGRPILGPGRVVVFRLDEVGLEDPDPRFSLHDLSFGGTLRLAQILRLRLPEIHVVGYALSSLSCLDGPDLSAQARAAVTQAVGAVRGLLTAS